MFMPWASPEEVLTSATRQNKHKQMFYLPRKEAKLGW